MFGGYFSLDPHTWTYRYNLYRHGPIDMELYRKEIERDIECSHS